MSDEKKSILISDTRPQCDPPKGNGYWKKNGFPSNIGIVLNLQISFDSSFSCLTWLVLRADCFAFDAWLR